MFVEYSYSLDADKAVIKLNTKALNKNIEKDEIYLDKESDGFNAYIRLTRNNKVYDEQKWLLQCREKGVKGKRLWTKGYLLDLLIVGIVALALLVCIVFAFVMPQIGLEMLLCIMAMVLILLFYIWKRIFTPIVALKIFLIEQL